MEGGKGDERKPGRIGVAEGTGVEELCGAHPAFLAPVGVAVKHEVMAAGFKEPGEEHGVVAVGKGDGTAGSFERPVTAVAHVTVKEHGPAESCLAPVAVAEDPLDGKAGQQGHTLRGGDVTAMNDGGDASIAEDVGSRPEACQLVVGVGENAEELHGRDSRGQPPLIQRRWRRRRRRSTPLSRME